MRKKIKYSDEPIGKVKIISDFLPSPEKLALKDESVKVTISLSKASVEFFKNEAKKSHIASILALHQDSPKHLCASRILFKKSG